MTLPFLPKEIWGHIFCALTTADLLNISLASKPLHQLVEPTLYSEFDNYCSRFKRAVFRVSIHPNWSILPDLSFIKSNEWIRLQHRMIAATENKKLCDCWLTKVTEKRFWWDAVVGFMIHALSDNLESLTMANYDSLDEYSYIGELSKLSKVEILGSELDFMKDYTSNKILSYLKLRSLTHFIDHNIYRVAHGPHLPTLSIQSIALTNCQMTNEELRDFLWPFSNLKRLSRANSVFSWYSSRYAGIFNVIGATPQLQGHLEELIVDEKDNNQRPLPQTYLSNFSHYTTLRTIVVDSTTALGRPAAYIGELYNEYSYGPEQVNDLLAILPPSLERLTITKSQYYILGCISHIVSCETTSLRKLEQVTLHFDHSARLRGNFLRNLANESWKTVEESGVYLQLKFDD
ncbi:uncharacterized protein PAC_08976 [Phialocephala subalpina]|uniref:F-box domain-containing protein n=1 Tax=Phialocephala subalpina TaxID=576137 RepID=A0A1L7X246_9HELO|nr:uncharacterized protein PAC_08976 [Phialocephala subalpina]